MFIAEGEKGVDAIRSLGLTATCSPGGAGKWRSEYSPHLAGRRVVILPDNDEAGRAHAEQVAASVARHAADTRVLELPGLPPKGDVADLIEAGGTAERLLELATLAAKPIAVSTDAVEAPTPLASDRTAIDAVVAEFNARYMVVNEAGKAIVYEPAHDIVLNRRHYERITFDDLKRLYLNRRVRVGHGRRRQADLQGGR